jgi:hypothetical protein
LINLIINSLLLTLKRQVIAQLINFSEERCMNRILFILVVMFTALPLQASTTYPNIRTPTSTIERSPLDKSIAPESSISGGEVGIHRGLGPNTGRSINHNHKKYAVPGERSEFYQNNSGGGSMGPGSY